MAEVRAHNGVPVTDNFSGFNSSPTTPAATVTATVTVTVTVTTPSIALNAVISSYTNNNMSTLIIPGDSANFDAAEIALGPGMFTAPITGEIVPTQAGLLQVGNKSIHIESNGRRYVPSVNDYVIGIVTGSFGDTFRVALSNFSYPVSLSAMAFPNASKKNRPNLKVGNLVYARVSSASPEVDVEVECMDPTTGKDGGFGLLEGGYVFDVNLAFARVLLFDTNHPLLNLLVKKCKFEIAIGLNGKIWIKTDELKYTLAASKSIERCQHVPSSDFTKTINATFKELNL